MRVQGGHPSCTQEHPLVLLVLASFGYRRAIVLGDILHRGRDSVHLLPLNSIDQSVDLLLSDLSNSCLMLGILVAIFASEEVGLRMEGGVAILEQSRPMVAREAGVEASLGVTQPLIWL